MEYLILNDYPHLKSRHDKLREAQRVEGQWSAFFRTKYYKRMKLHAEKLRENIAILIGRKLNLTDDDELFTIVRSSGLGYIVLARGKADVS